MVGMGAVYTRTHTGQPLRDEDDFALCDGRIKQYFDPYAGALRQVVRQRLGACRRAVIIDLHSFPRLALAYELHGKSVRPHMCLGVDAVHTSASLQALAARASAGFDTAINSPFAGTYVPLSFYGVTPDVLSIMIEIRRDQYLNSDLTPREAGVDALVSSIVDLIDVG